MITYHALDGMRIVSSTQELVDSINFIIEHPEIEICCSNEEGTEQYGDIAIAVEGRISHMFECDVVSKVDENGKRYATKHSEWECSEERFLEQCMPEAWVSYVSIKYIRIKEYGGRRKRHYTERYDMYLLERLNIPIIIV